MSVEESLLKDAARVTVAFFFTFVWAIAIQGQNLPARLFLATSRIEPSFAAKQKYAAMAAHRVAKKSDPKRIFNRYSDEAILSGDRAVGNYVEWMVSEYATFCSCLIFLSALTIRPEHTAATECQCTGRLPLPLLGRRTCCWSRCHQVSKTLAHISTSCYERTVSCRLLHRMGLPQKAFAALCSLIAFT